MAVSLGKSGRGRYRPLAEINVTPLVDVMLVLLIIFMVTAPLMTSSLDIDLPHSDAASASQDPDPITVAVDAQGHAYLLDATVELPELVGKLQAMTKDQRDRRIYVMGDRTNNYGRVMDVLFTIRKGGFFKAALKFQGGAGPEGPEPPAATSGATSTPPSTPAPASQLPASPLNARPKSRG